jgi:mono/diheme cytochrome c family protein
MRISAFLFFVTIACLTGCTATPPAAPPATPTKSTAPAQPTPQPATPPDKTAQGKALFEANGCVGCHGPNGKGTIQGAPNFTDIAWQSKGKDESLAKSIKNGKGKTMPAFKAGQGTDEEIALLVRYVRHLGSVDQPAPLPKASKGVPPGTKTEEQ